MPLLTPTAGSSRRFESDYYVEGYATTFDDPYVLYEYDGVQYKEVIDRHALDGADLSRVGISLNVACLSLYYGLFLDLLLLPVGAAMKRRLRELDQGERPQGSISVRSSRRRAG